MALTITECKIEENITLAKCKIIYFIVYAETRLLYSDKGTKKKIELFSNST